MRHEGTVSLQLSENLKTALLPTILPLLAPTHFGGGIAAGVGRQTQVCCFGHGWAAGPGILPEASGTNAFPWLVTDWRDVCDLHLEKMAVQIPALPLSCATLAKLITSPVPRFPPLSNANNER